MKVLVLCEFSGTVRDAFIRRGHQAISCDILPSESDFGPHLQMDAFEAIALDKWDLLIAHPPCTFLTNSGARWLYGGKGKNPDPIRWGAMYQACEFFCRIKNADVARIAIENPIPHAHARKIIGDYTQIIHPWQFGHGESKATCLWLKDLPTLKPTNIVDGREPKVHYASPGKDRWKVRSITPKGFGDAMAEQWGNS